MTKIKKRELLVGSLSEYIISCQKENSLNMNQERDVRKAASALIEKIENAKTLNDDFFTALYSPKRELVSLDLVKTIVEDKNLNIEQLNTLWQTRDHNIWGEDPSYYIVFAEKAVALASPLLAYDISNEGLSVWPSNIRLRQLYALSTMRIGISDKANEILYKLYDEGERSEETLGMLGSTYKSFWQRQSEKPIKIHFAKQSIKFYGEAYQVSKGRWSGINYATMLLVSGEKDKAKNIANEVKNSCLKEYQTMSKDNYDYYWVIATLGEATFILREFNEAKEWYLKANSINEGKLGDLISTRKNLKLLFEYIGVKESIKKEFDDLFDIPAVIAFTGHMIDREESQIARFPASLEEDISKQIVKKVKDFGDVIGYSSGASGADILFLEALTGNNCKMNIVLPCNVDDFMKYSVDYLEGGSWGDRFLKLLNSSSDVTTISKHVSGLADIPFDFANKIIYGMARMMAQQLDSELIPLAVWSDDSDSLAGGTGSVIDYWKKYEKKIEIININKSFDKKLHDSNVNNTNEEISEVTSLKNERRKSGQIMGMLFADTVNYSKLNDREMIKFGNIISEIIKKINEEKKFKIVHCNSWGDAFFFVFKDVSDAGIFALDFVEEINRIDWKEYSFSCHIQLRTALHAGAIYECKNPVTGENSYNGANVCRVARMESVTPPGQVFCSLEFAAYSSALHVKDYVCDYVGKIIMPKQFGEFPTYHLRRK